MQTGGEPSVLARPERAGTPVPPLAMTSIFLGEFLLKAEN